MDPTAEGGAVLDALDSDSDRGQVYRVLVGHPRSSVAALACRAGLSDDAVRAALGELAAEGMVVAVDPEADAWEAHSPAEVTEALLLRDSMRHAGLRRAGLELEQLFRFARRETGHYGALEVVEDPVSIMATMQRLQRNATTQVRHIDRPPFWATAGYYVDQETLQRERMAAGVAYRTIYFESAYDDPVTGPNMARMVEAGEQARTLDEPPMKLTLGDDQLAVTVLQAEGRSGVVALLIRPSSLLTALSNVFETLWKLAIPVSTAGVDTGIDDRDRSILMLMASGATDDAIARRLDLSRRTVVRRMAALLTRLGATTRFQAGVQAARRGWL